MQQVPLRLEEYPIDKQRKVCVVREDYLDGGSKVRGLVPYMLEIIRNRPTVEEFVYSSPAYGYAQVAIAVAARILGVKAVIFVANRKVTHANTLLAEKYGAKINRVNYGYLVVTKKYARDYVEGDPSTRYLLPWGLADDHFKDVMVNSLKQVITPTIVSKIGTMWVTVGSGTIFEILSRVFPHAKFNLVQVGASYKVPDNLVNRVKKVYVAPEKYENMAKKIPPYPANSWYDAKIWQFVLSDAVDGDYIWNVA